MVATRSVSWRISPAYWELLMVKTHSDSGYEMLMKVDLPINIAQTICQHHERCDGTGYPRGLSGSELSMEAQILMVADVVEAMMSHRPYRPALGLGKALEEIRTNRGRRYNSAVVSACLSLFEEDHYKIDDSEHEIDFKLQYQDIKSCRIDRMLQLLLLIMFLVRDMGFGIPHYLCGGSFQSDFHHIGEGLFSLR